MGSGDASGRFLIRMDPGLHAALREAARAAGTSLNDYCQHKLAAAGHGGLEPVETVVGQAARILGPALLGVVAFGSWARGEATESSDVDILIVAEPGTEITRELYRRWDKSPLRWDGHAVEPHFVLPPSQQGRLSGLWAEAAIDGIVLFERGFELSRRLASVRARIASGEITRRWSNGHPYWVAA